MRLGLLASVVLAAGLLARPAPADAPASAPAPAPMQPPMNTFDYAYYDCEAGAFEIDYDSDTPTQATIITSNHNQKYALTRSASSSGVEFAGRGVKFWTDGKKVLVQGTSIPLANCRLKGK